MTSPWTYLYRETRRRVDADAEIVRLRAALADVTEERDQLQQAVTESGVTPAVTGDVRARQLCGAILARRDVKLALPARLYEHWCAQYEQLGKGAGWRAVS